MSNPDISIAELTVTEKLSFMERIWVYLEKNLPKFLSLTGMAIFLPEEFNQLKTMSPNSSIGHMPKNSH